MSSTPISKFRARWLLAVIVLHCLYSGTQARAQADLAHDSYYYQLQPVPASDRTVLDISLEFKSDTPLVVGLPTDYYGTPRIHQYITSFEGARGTTVAATGSDTERLVNPNHQGIISIRYVISYDPAEMDRYAFAPVTGPSFFYVAGCQWLLPIGDLERNATYHFKLASPPEGWRFYTSQTERADSMVTLATYEDLASLSLGGCSNDEVRKDLDIKGRPVRVYIQGRYEFDPDSVLEGIERLVWAQREWFNDFEQAFYNITILPRTGLLAGTAESNLFVCFIDQATEPAALYKLISHEMFHYWLPGKMGIQPENAEYDFEFDWFHEGFTDYLSRLILFEVGVLSQASLVQSLNFDIVSIANNPSANDSYQQLVSLADAGQFRSAQKKLAYYRGSLIALGWDEALKAHGSDLRQFVLALRDTADGKGGQLSFDDLVSVGRSYGLPVERDIARYITRGEPISPPANVLGRFTLSPTEVKLFDPGFDLGETSRRKIITGVVEGSAAYTAGLRNGMPYVRRRNSNRFSNSWSPTKPLQVTVLIDGAERVIEYFAIGKPKTLMLYK